MTQSSPSAERILVVDDEPEIVALVAYHLAKAGYRVATASTGEDALDAARRERLAAAGARNLAADHAETLALIRALLE